MITFTLWLVIRLGLGGLWHVKAARPSSNQLEPRFDGDHQVASGLDAQGREIVDGVPMSPPVGYDVPDTLEQIVSRLVRGRELAEAADRAGLETFEEADDFDMEEEDYDPRFPETIYEAYFEAKSKRRAQAEARRESVSQTASEGLVSPASPEMKVETPSVVGSGASAVASPESGPASSKSTKPSSVSK